jgi:hypothetical protein
LLARLISGMPGLLPLEAKSILHRLAMPWRTDVTAPNVTEAPSPDSPAPVARAGRPPPDSPAPAPRVGRPPPK